ncbi:carbonate dehydratase protein [Rutstroemia sp. NJR-2017a BBW]|nr:carbonate dehydratase protein [Rutstroemia sp. NJR-2017a BBW]
MSDLTPIQEHILKANEAYAKSFTKIDLPVYPTKHYAIITCMDARINPLAAFGIKLGEAHIIRNGGGNVKEGMRSLLASTLHLETKEILVIKHTNCGLSTVSNWEAMKEVATNLGAKALLELETTVGHDIMPIDDLEEAVRKDVEYLKSSALIKDDVVISGWVYDIETGRVRKLL